MENNSSRGKQPGHPKMPAPGKNFICKREIQTINILVFDRVFGILKVFRIFPANPAN